MTVSRGHGLDVGRGPGQPGHSPHPLIPSNVITPGEPGLCSADWGGRNRELWTGRQWLRGAQGCTGRIIALSPGNTNLTFRVVSQSYGQEDYGNSRPRGTSLSLPTPHYCGSKSCTHQLPPPLGGRQKETSSAPDRKSQKAGQLSPPGEDKQDGEGTGQTSGGDWCALRATGAAHGRERRAGAREIKHSQQDGGPERAGVGRRKKVSEIGNKGNGRQTNGGQKRSEC